MHQNMTGMNFGHLPASGLDNRRLYFLGDEAIAGDLAIFRLILELIFCQPCPPGTVIGDEGA